MERFHQLRDLVQKFRESRNLFKTVSVPFDIRGKHVVQAQNIRQLLAMIKYERSRLVFRDHKGRWNFSEGLIFTQNSSSYVLNGWTKSKIFFLTGEHAFKTKYDKKEEVADGDLIFKLLSVIGERDIAKSIAKHGVKDLDKDLDDGEVKYTVAQFEMFIIDTRKTLVVRNARVLTSTPPVSRMFLSGILERC